MKSRWVDAPNTPTQYSQSADRNSEAIVFGIQVCTFLCHHKKIYSKEQKTVKENTIENTSYVEFARILHWLNFQHQSCKVGHFNRSVPLIECWIANQTLTEWYTCISIIGEFRIHKKIIPMLIFCHRLEHAALLQCHKLLKLSNHGVWKEYPLIIFWFPRHSQSMLAFKILLLIYKGDEEIWRFGCERRITPEGVWGHGSWESFN